MQPGHRATLTQPLQCVSQHPVANLHASTGNTRWQQSCSDSNAICHHSFKKRIELRTQEQPLVAEHRGGTNRVRNDRSRNRRTHEVPFIAGCSHFTRKNTRFHAPASSPTQPPCNIHAAIAIAMLLAAFPSSPLPLVITSQSHHPPLVTTSQCHHFPSSPLPIVTTSLPHHFPSSPLPIVTTSLRHHFPSSPLRHVTTSLRHHFPKSPPSLIVTASQRHHFPSSPLPFLTTSLPHHFPSSPLPFLTTSLRHHFPSSPLPFLTTSQSLRTPLVTTLPYSHHFPTSPLPFVTMSPPFINVKSHNSFCP